MPKCNEKNLYDSLKKKNKTKHSFFHVSQKKQNLRYNRFQCLLYLSPGVLKILAILLSNCLTKSQKNVDILFAHKKNEH